MHRLSQDYKVAIFPIRVLLGFLIFTEMLLFFSPIDFPLQSPGLLILYFCIVNYMLYAGYKTGIRKYSFAYKSVPATKTNFRLVKVTMVMGFLLVIPRIINGWGLTNISLTTFFSKFLTGLVNPGMVYNDKLNAEVSGHAIIFLLLSPIIFSAVAFGIYYYNKLSRGYRLIALLLIMAEIIYWLGIGTRKGIGDIIIILLFLILASHPNYILQKKYKHRFWLISGVFISSFIFYFVYSNLSRSGFEASELLDMDTFKYDIKPYYRENVSPYIYLPIAQISNYLCQGYYALSCALDAFFIQGESVFSYGFGNNWFTINLMERIAPEVDIQSMTYLNYLSQTYGIDPLVNWHSIYVWLANDFTFFGVFPIMYIIGRLFANVWLDTYYGVNLYAVPLCALLVLMIFYFFANNQILSFSFIPLFSIYTLYVLHRRPR